MLHREGQHGAGAIPHDVRFAADLMEPAVQIQDVAQGVRVVQVVGGGKGRVAARQRAVGMALPFLWMIFSSFKPLDEIFIKPPKLLPMAWTTQNYQTAFSAGGFYSSFFNSFYIATVVTVV